MSAASYAAESGLTLGSALAMILSWSLNHSIPWAVVHGVCSWWYVLYFALVQP